MAYIGRVCAWVVFTIALTTLTFSEASAETLPGSITHQIERDDDLMKISYWYYGTHQRWRDIQQANPQIDPKTLAPGMKVQVPNPLFNIVRSGSEKPSFVITEHTVAAGEDLKTISKKYYRNRSKSNYLKMANPEVKEGQLVAGMKIRVPHPRDLGRNIARQAELAVKNPVAKVEKPAPLLAEKKPEPEKVERAPAKAPVLERKVAKVEPKPQPVVKPAPPRKDMVSKKAFQELEKSYLVLKAKNQELKEASLLSKRYKNEIQRLQKENVDLEDKYRRLVKQRKESQKVGQLELYSTLTQSNSQVMQEKVRLLNQRIWLEKNKVHEKCTVQVARAPDDSGDTAERVRLLVEKLNLAFGSELVFFNQAQGEIVFVVDGSAVYGANNPSVKREFRDLFAEVNEYLAHVAIEEIEFVGHSHAKLVYDRNGRKVSGYQFLLNQSNALKDFFVQQLGWQENRLIASSFGASRKEKFKKKKKKKRFEVKLRLAQSFSPNRKLASIRNDPALMDIESDLLSALGEPKFAKVLHQKDALEIHLGQHYLISEQIRGLSDSGKAKLKTIMDLLSLSSDATYEFVWVPGYFDDDKEKNLNQSLRYLDQIQSYITNDLSIPADRVKVSRYSRLRKISLPKDWRDEKMNRRLIVRVEVNSAAYRNLGEVE